MGEYSQVGEDTPERPLSFIHEIPDSLHARSKLAELTLTYSPSWVAVSTNDRHRRGGQVWRFNIYGYKRIIAFPQRRAEPINARSFGNRWRSSADRDLWWCGASYNFRDKHLDRRLAESKFKSHLADGEIFRDSHGSTSSLEPGSRRPVNRRVRLSRDNQPTSFWGRHLMPLHAN